MELIKTKKNRNSVSRSPTNPNATVVNASGKKVLLVKGNIGRVGFAFGTARHSERRR